MSRVGAGRSHTAQWYTAQQHTAQQHTAQQHTAQQHTAQASTAKVVQPVNAATRSPSGTPEAQFGTAGDAAGRDGVDPRKATSKDHAAGVSELQPYLVAAKFRGASA